MRWYRVVKTIKGHPYVYQQRTWREGKRVRTESRYVGPAAEERSKPPVAPALGTVVTSPVWRVESGHRHDRGSTAWDVVRYESEELGNEYLRQQIDRVCSEGELRERAAGDLVWVTRTAAAARRYGSAVEKVVLPAGSRVIAIDRDGGFWVLRGS